MKPQPKTGRNATRFAAELPAVVHLGPDVACNARNLSRTGVLLVGNLPLSGLPKTVRLTLHSTSGDLELTLAGQVMRTAVDEEDGSQIGIEFAPLEGPDRDTLEALVQRVIEGGNPAALEGIEGSTPEQIRQALEKVPLAHRVALAQRAVPREREILLHDPQMVVIDALARNPNLLPQETMAILRMRNLMPRTLEALGRDSKWAGSENMRILIASHPNAPMALAERLAAGLGPTGLKRLLVTPGLQPALRLKLGGQRRGK